MAKVSCASRIKEALIIRELKPTDLCAMTEISKATMSQYINGLYEPSQIRTEIIAKALNVNEAWLMGYDVPMERSKPTIQIDDRLLSEIKKRPLLEELFFKLSQLDDEHLDAFMKIIGLHSDDQQDQ